MSNNNTAAAIIQFPIWKSSNRALPNVIVRSSLFTARNSRTPRDYRDNELLAVVGPGEIRYTGKELRQDDEDVLMCLVHIAKEIYGNRELAEPEKRYRIPFNRGRLIADLGWTRNTRSYQRLRACMTRLKATELMVRVSLTETADAGRSVSLLTEYAWNEDEYWAEIPSLFFALYGQQYTSLNWAQRQKLPAGLARWLQAYTLSHKKCLPVKIETIAKGAGLEIPKNSNEKRKFRQILRRACKELVEAGVLLEAGVYNDLFIYEKMSQSAGLLET